ncbi:HipA domain-containing protein [Pararhizobium polonicum]|uniref:HipA domain-containing protein n=1 Tax=Pararhizobium polonicum TaxID=1612624 RepID=UPI000B1A7EFC|nr:HipA domain-containing protein [Pararhizobium polonicum]
MAKALINDHQAGKPRKLIAKFSATNDTFAMVKAEFATVRLAACAGMTVAPVEIDRVLDRDVLLVERHGSRPGIMIMRIRWPNALFANSSGQFRKRAADG